MKSLFIHQKKVNAVVFDFDGTLAELNIDFNLMRESINHLLESYGIDHRQLKNGYILEKMHEAETLLRNQSSSAATSFLSDAYRAIEKIEVEAAFRGRLFETTRELLSTLGRHHIGTGIVTRNCRRAVQTVFPDILTYCPVVVCREDVINVKPDPGHLIQALNLLNAVVNDSLMIGDHPLDIQTGQNAGALTAGVLTGHYKQDDFIRAGADVVLPRATDLLAHMKDFQPS